MNLTKILAASILLFTATAARAAQDASPNAAVVEAAIATTLAQAETGDAESQYAMALIYGTPGREDARAQAYWALKAAQQGLAEAQFLLSELYREGRGLAKDEAKARLWLRQSAYQGYGPASDRWEQLETQALKNAVAEYLARAD